VSRSKWTRDRWLYLIGAAMLVSQTVIALLDRPVAGEIITGGVAVLMAPGVLRHGDRRNGTGQ
jgi:hypothetical protein